MNNEEPVQPYIFKPYQFELVRPSPTSAVPAARSGHRIVCSLKHLYLFGGYNPHLSLAQHNSVFPELWKFNFATKSWEKCAEGQNFPQALVSVAAIRRRQKLLIYGGTGVPFGLTSSNELYSIKLHESTGFAKIKITGKGPQPQYGQAIVMHKNSLYTIGGTTGFAYTCDIHRVNLNKDPRLWKPLYIKRANRDLAEEAESFQPEGRYRHEVAFDGENIYVLGGGSVRITFNLINIPAFNIKTRLWQNLKTKGDPNNNPQYPQGRKCHGVVQVKTDNDIHVFVMGGYHNNLQVFNDLWKLELSTLQWTLMQNCILPKALYFHSITLTREGKLYVFGGIQEGLSLNYTNEMYSAWVRIPKLSEIAWEALLHYFPRTCSNSALSGLLLPNHFIDRLE